MEIFIIGGILVALMVYVSTKIKKSAAAAYEPETVDTESFFIKKPEGFLYPLRDESKFAFEAYTNTYGEGAARSIWKAQAQIKILTDKKIKAVVAEVKKNADEILSEKLLKDAPAGQKISLIESARIEEEHKRREFWKIIEDLKSKKVYELRISVLNSYVEEYADKIKTMLESFAVK